MFSGILAARKRFYLELPYPALPVGYQHNLRLRFLDPVLRDHKKMNNNESFDDDTPRGRISLRKWNLEESPRGILGCHPNSTKRPNARTSENIIIFSPSKKNIALFFRKNKNHHGSHHIIMRLTTSSTNFYHNPHHSSRAFYDCKK